MNTNATPHGAAAEPAAHSAVIGAPSVHPIKCPRCTRGAMGATDWCCWELVVLEAVMRADPLPTMSAVRVVFPGRSADAIRKTCRRYRLPVPKADGIRRRRCAACGDLFEGAPGARCCPRCVNGERDVERAS